MEKDTADFTIVLQACNIVEDIKFPCFQFSFKIRGIKQRRKHNLIRRVSRDIWSFQLCHKHASNESEILLTSCLT